MNLRRNIKSQARQALQGCWAPARVILIIVTSLSVLISMLDSAVMGMLGYEFTYSSINSFSYSEDFFFSPASITVTAAMWAVRLLILTPLGVGMVNWYRQLTDRRRLGASYIFWVYEGRAWLRSIWVAVTIGLRLLGVAALLFALPLLMVIEAEFITLSPVLVAVVWWGGWLLGAVATFILAIFAKRYALVPMLLGEQYNMTSREAVRASVRYTKGHCVELLLVDLSFLPWVLPLIALSSALLVTVTIAYDPLSLLPILLMGLVSLATIITIFKVQPYYTMTQVMYARYLYEYGCASQGDQPAHETVHDTMRRYGYEQPAAPQPAVWQPVDDAVPPTAPPPTTGGVVWQDITD